jgi:hypothetical protein
MIGDFINMEKSQINLDIMSAFRVKVIAAEKLRKMDLLGKSDPFVKGSNRKRFRKRHSCL